VELRRFIDSGIAASAIGHLSLLTLVLIFAEVHPFGSVTAETIAVDIVASEEIAKKPETPAPQTPPLDFSALAKPAAVSAPTPADASSPAPAAPQAPAARPQQQAAPVASRPDRSEAAAQPQPRAASPAPAYIPPEPDLSIKYHVLLGLPPAIDVPQASSGGDKTGDGLDVPDKADIASSLVAEFRRHLKTCSRLPGSVAPSDNIRIKLRVFMTPEARLAAEPVLIEASASIKGPLLMQSAIAALQACQPYRMLPANRYGEWKVLDLNFTAQDFAG
jgi:hypothetical protein